MAILLSFVCHTVVAQEPETATLEGTDITYRYTPIVEDNRTALERYLDTDLSDRKVRFNILGGPGYSANTGWRLAAIANLYYRQADEDVATPGVVTAWASASLTGYYNVTINGINSLHKGRHRLYYGMGLRSEPTYLWGLDYDTAKSGMAGRYTARDYRVEFKYQYRFTRSLFISIGAGYQNIEARRTDLRTEQLTIGCNNHPSTFTLGVGLGIDTRRWENNTTRGIYAAVECAIRPKLLSNIASNLYELNITFDYYQPLWRGATLALDLYGEFHNAATPWLLRAEIGGENRMRGYYRGRYNGDNMVTAQIELRQHLWEGLGIALWGGTGEVFSSDDRFSSRKILPTYGAGLRWSFNALMAIRLEMAFGRDSRYFILGFNEAF